MHSWWKKAHEFSLETIYAKSDKQDPAQVSALSSVYDKATYFLCVSISRDKTKPTAGLKSLEQQEQQLHQ